MFQPQDLSEPIRTEFLRVRAQIGEEDPYSSPTTLGIHDVLLAHFLIAEFFSIEGRGIGGIGPKSVDLLHSAVFRQHVSLGGQKKWKDPYSIAATLMFGIIKDHVFHDANKRTAFLAGLFLLDKHGRVPRVPENEFEDVLVELADNNLDKYARYRDYKKNKSDPEVEFLSFFLRHNTRERDTRFYCITYRELEAILSRFHCALVNPNNNYIDLVQQIPVKQSLFKKSIVYETKRIARIGYPGRTKQVSESTIKQVREALGLTAERGFDSQTFYYGVEPVEMLVARYQSALKRLADR